MGGAHAPGHLELSVEDVDADDLAGAPDPGALDDRESHAAAAEDGDGLTGLEPRGSERGAHTGEHAAPDERRPVERQVGVDLHDRVLVEQHALGVARDADELAERSALLREARRAGFRSSDEAGDAEIGMTAQALLAASAEAREAGHHVIAGLDGRHIGADRLDDTGTLVSQDDRPVERKPADAVHDV